MMLNYLLLLMFVIGCGSPEHKNFSFLKQKGFKIYKETPVLDGYYGGGIKVAFFLNGNIRKELFLGEYALYHDEKNKMPPLNKFLKGKFYSKINTKDKIIEICFKTRIRKKGQRVFTYIPLGIKTRDKYLMYYVNPERTKIKLGEIYLKDEFVVFNPIKK